MPRRPQGGGVVLSTCRVSRKKGEGPTLLGDDGAEMPLVHRQDPLRFPTARLSRTEHLNRRSGSSIPARGLAQELVRALGDVGPAAPVFSDPFGRGPRLLAPIDQEGFTDDLSLAPALFTGQLLQDVRGRLLQ